jgi:Protein of unknown function (DUF2786)
MMSTDRDSLITKIQALMAKTVDAGCTEEEALSALDKVRALMDAYEITEAELQLSKEEKAILRSEPPGSSDAHSIKFFLVGTVAEFCDCKGWKGTDGIVFCGLPTDARLATWLLDSLTAFVQAELARHLMGCLAPKNERRRVISGFVSGCCGRINERLRALRKQSAAAATSNGRELVAVKGTAVDDRMKADGICLRFSRSQRQQDEASHRAGRSAGERASFGRPVTGTNAALRISAK